jgi:NADPH:quinone reductase-like Zn-dependent oxidoreductase
MGRKKLRGFIAKLNKPDLMLLKGLLEEGKVAPVIDRSYPLSNMAEAVRYLEEGHARGKVVIPIAQS